MTEQTQDEQTPLSNSERLRAHLEAGSLAAEFLEAWFKPGLPQERHARLLAALDTHVAKEAGGNVHAPVE